MCLMNVNGNDHGIIIIIFLKNPVFIHKCATCSELPANICNFGINRGGLKSLVSPTPYPKTPLKIPNFG